MKEFWEILGLFFTIISTPKSLVHGRTDSSLSQSSVAIGVYANIGTMPSQALNTTPLTAKASSFQATKKWQTTIITSNINKRNEASFTTVSNKQIAVPALSTSSAVAQSQLNEFIKSVLSTNVLPENLATEYSSLNAQNSVFKENSFAISSIPSVMTPEIALTTSKVSGMYIHPSSSGDKMHLSTFQKDGKSLVSSQEAFTKSAFSYPSRESREFNSRTAPITRSNSILVQINSYDAIVRSHNETKLFTKGSVSLTNRPRTFSISSTIWKTAKLKPSPESTSYLSPNKETSQRSTQTFDTKIRTATMKGKFSGISGISQTTTEAKMSPGDNWFTSPFISTSRATGIAATSVEASAAYGPPSVKQQKNMSLSSVVTASPMMSGKSKRLSSTDTMTIFATPRFVQSSVNSLIISDFSSRTKTEFRAVTKGNTDNDMQGLSSVLAHTSSSCPASDVVPKYSDQSVASLDESTPFVPKKTLRSTKVSTLSTLVETNSHLTEGIQTAPSLQSKTSEQISVMSPSFEENFPSSRSVKITQNVVKKTSVYLKVTSEALDEKTENLFSPYSLQTKFIMHSTDWAVSTMSEQFSLMTSSILNIDHHVRFSQFSESSVVSQELVAPSFFLAMSSRSQMQNKTNSISTTNTGNRIGLSSYQSLSTVAPSSSSPVISRSEVPHQSSTIPTGSHHEQLPFTSMLGHQIHLSSSQSSAVPSELVLPSSSSMTSRVYIPNEKSSAFTGSYHDPPSSTSKIERQIRLSSSQSASLSTELVVPSSTWQSPSHVPTEKRSVVRESHREPVISNSGIRHQIPSTSSPSSVVSTAYVEPSSSPVASRSKIPHYRSSLSTGSYHDVLLSTSQIGHQIRFSSSQSSAVSTVEDTASSPLQSRSQIAHSNSSSITTNQQAHLTSSKIGYQIHYSSKSAASLTTIASPSSSFLKSRYQIPHNRSSVSIDSYSTIDHQIRLPSSESSVISTELVQPSSHTMSHSQTPHLKTTSVTTSIVHESLPVTSKIGHHAHFSSIQGSVTSKELLALSVLRTQSLSQTPHNTIAVPTSTGFHEPLLSTSEIGHVHFSSAQSSVASTELVAPSSYPKINSQGPQKRSSAGSKHSTPSSSASSTGSTFVDRGKLKTSSSAVAPSNKEFTSKINVRLVPAESTQLDTTVTPTEPFATSSAAIAGSLSTGYPATTTTESQHVNLLVMVAIVPSVVLCVFFAAVMFFRRNRRRKEKNFKYSIKLEYKDSIRSRCVNSRLDLSLKEIHIDLELPNASNERAQTRDSAGYSRGPSLTEMQMRELQILSQECKENLEWISEVIARDMETSICGRQPVNRESVYSVKEKSSYEPNEKIIRRESSKRGRETVKWRVPIVRRRDSGDFDQRDSICTDDTTLTPDCKDERAFDRSNCKNVDKTGRVNQSPQMKGNVESHANKDHRGPLSNNKLDELQRQNTDKKEKEFEENKQTVKDETPQKKHSGKRFETL